MCSKKVCGASLHRVGEQEVWNLPLDVSKSLMISENGGQRSAHPVDNWPLSFALGVGSWGILPVGTGPASAAHSGNRQAAWGLGVSLIQDGPSAAGLVFEMEEPADKTGHRPTPGTRCLAPLQRVF